MSAEGERLGAARIAKDPLALAAEVAKAGSEVVLEATYGWYWAAEVLKDCGARVNIAHALWRGSRTGG